MKHSELVDIGAKWLRLKAPNTFLRCQYVVTEFMSACSEIPDIYGLRSYQNVMIEAKVSRADFKRDFRKNKSWGGIGFQKYYLCPTRLIEIKELPNKFGLLYCDNKGNVEIIKRSESFEERNRNGEDLIYYSIIRRLAKSQVFNFKE